MFWDADHCPSFSYEGLGHTLVTGLVVDDLFCPEVPPEGRCAATFSAAVPETAVEEDDGAQPREDKVGLADE